MYILNVCSSSGMLKIFAFLNILLKIILIIVPIGLIIMVSIDFAKAVISGDPEASKKSIELGFNRILYAIILFAVPYIVSLIVTVLDNMGAEYATCLELADNPEAIAQLEKEEEAKKQAKLEAKKNLRANQTEKAKEAAEKQRIALEYVKNYNGSGAKAIQGEGCDGVVYYENGTFYRPSYNLVFPNGTEATKGSAKFGYNKYFYGYLLNFVKAAKEAGHTIIPSETTDGAWRSYERQQYFWNCYQTGNCNNGNLAAEPGKSNHGWAIASDLSFGNLEEDLYWAHDHANEYNLNFPLCENVRTGPCKENWHIEPLSISEDDERARACVE